MFLDALAESANVLTPAYAVRNHQQEQRRNDYSLRQHWLWGRDEIDHLINVFLVKYPIPDMEMLVEEMRMLLEQCDLGFVYHYSPITDKLVARCSWKTLLLLEPYTHSMFLRAFGFNTRDEWAMRTKYTTIDAISREAADAESQLWLNDDEVAFYNVANRRSVTQADRELRASVASLYHFGTMRAYASQQGYNGQHDEAALARRTMYNSLAFPVFDVPFDVLDSASRNHGYTTCARWLATGAHAATRAMWEQLQGMLDPSDEHTSGLLPFAMRTMLLEDERLVGQALDFRPAIVVDRRTSKWQLPAELGRVWMVPVDTMCTNYADMVTMPARVRNAWYDSCDRHRVMFFKQIPFVSIANVERILPMYVSATSAMTYYVRLTRIRDRDEFHISALRRTARRLKDAGGGIRALRRMPVVEGTPACSHWICVTALDEFNKEFSSTLVNVGDFYTHDPDGGAIPGMSDSRDVVVEDTYFNTLVGDLVDNGDVRVEFSDLLHANEPDVADTTISFGNAFAIADEYIDVAKKKIGAYTGDYYGSIVDRRAELIAANIGNEKMTIGELKRAYVNRLTAILNEVFLDADVVRFFSDKKLTGDEMARIYDQKIASRVNTPSDDRDMQNTFYMVLRRQYGQAPRRDAHLRYLRESTVDTSTAEAALFGYDIFLVLLKLLESDDALVLSVRGMYYSEDRLRLFFKNSGAMGRIEHLHRYRVQRAAFQTVRFLRFYAQRPNRVSLFDRFYRICPDPEEVPALAEAVRAYDRSPSAIALSTVGAELDNAAWETCIKQKKHLLMQEVLFASIEYIYSGFNPHLYFIYQLLSYVPARTDQRTNVSELSRSLYFMLPQNAVDDLRDATLENANAERLFNNAKLHVSTGDETEKAQRRVLCGSQTVLTMIEIIRQHWRSATLRDAPVVAETNGILEQLLEENRSALFELETDRLLAVGAQQALCLSEIRLLRAIHIYVMENSMFDLLVQLNSRFDKYRLFVEDKLKRVVEKQSEAVDEEWYRYDEGVPGMQRTLHIDNRAITTQLFADVFENGTPVVASVNDRADTEPLDSNELIANMRDTARADDAEANVPVTRGNAAVNEDALVRFFRPLLARTPQIGAVPPGFLELSPDPDESEPADDNDNDNDNVDDDEPVVPFDSSAAPIAGRPDTASSDELHALLAQYRARNAPSIERIQEQAKIAETEVRQPIDLVERFNELYFEFVNDRAHNRVGAEHLEPLDKLIAATRRSSAAHAALVRQAAYRVHEDIQRQLGVDELLVENSALLDNPHVRAMRETRWPMEKKYEDDVASATSSSSSSSASLEQAVHTLSDPYFLPAYQRHLTVDAIAAERRQNPCIRATLDRQRRALAAIGLTDARLADATLARDRKAWRDAYDRARCAVDADEEAYALLFEQGGFNFLVVSGEIALSDEDEEKARLLANLQKEDVVSF